MGGVGLGRRRPVAETAFWSRKRFGSKLLQKTIYTLAYKYVSSIYDCVIACLALLTIRFQRGIRDG